MKDALKWFRKSKTIDSYDATVNTYLSMLGDAYGIELAGERFVNSKGKCHGACPNDGEIWIAVKARSSGTFLYAGHEHLSVNFETEGGLVEFKTSRSVRKVNDLLVNASRKFGAYPGEKKAVVVSLLRLLNAEEEGACSSRQLYQRRNARRVCGSGARRRASQLNNKRRCSAQVPNPGGVRRS